MTASPAIDYAHRAAVWDLRQQLLDYSDDVAGFEYTRDFDFDPKDVGRFAGALAVANLHYLPGGFRFADTGILSAIIECLGADAETTIDLCAWPVDEPHEFTSALGVADALGIDQVKNPTSYFLNNKLDIRRTPLRWLQAKCQGIVILNESTIAEWLGVPLGSIAGEDLDHMRQLWLLLQGLLTPSQIFIRVEEVA